MALCGFNGVGKLTLLGLAGGLVRARSGRVRLDERDVASLPPTERARRIAIVPQGLLRWFELSLEHFVLQGRYCHKGTPTASEDRAAIDQALEQTDLSGQRDRSVARLSGGQRQRALFARALAQRAPVLLVDEPTAGLDPRHQLELVELLVEARDRGSTVVVATHELRLAVQFAERFLVLEGGTVRFDGSVESLERAPVVAEVFGPRFVFGAWRGTRGERSIPLAERD